MDFTDHVLRALAEGVTRLEDGDPNDIEQARKVRIQMLEDHGLVLEGGEWIYSSKATSGWAADGKGGSEFIGMGVTGKWPRRPGTAIFFDPDLTYFVRHTD